MATLNDLILTAREQVREMILKAFVCAQQADKLPNLPLPDFAVEIPADIAHGDFAANAAMVGARSLKLAPPKIAAALLESLDFTGSFFERAEIAGPGFLNFFLGREWFSQVLGSVSRMGAEYGRTDYGKGEKVMVEFVSANPTGPMHMGNARGGAIGDCLAAAMDAAGYAVSREFYVNDAGNQIEKFAISLEARYLQIYKGVDAVSFPEDGYQGDDIRVRAQEFADMHGDKYVNAQPAERKDALVNYALPKNIEKIQTDLAAYRIAYDCWFFESSLYQDDAVDTVVNKLREKNLTYEKEGALWYKATAFGSEKDEVLIRQNGNATYFAADIAYHYNKFAVRGFERVINVWGADHHGHVARIKGAMDAVGLDGSKLDIVLMQLVRLMKDGEPYRMSKRSGQSVTLSDLFDLVPVDAARFFFNMREANSAMDFDLDLAVEESSNNPVYYVQYAHARICSIIRKLNEEGVQPRECTGEELALLSAPEEIELTRVLAKLPGEIAGVASRYDPAGLTHYAIEVATAFHKFYTAHMVRGEDEALMQARLCLCLCTRTVIANTLALLRITAPETM